MAQVHVDADDALPVALPVDADDALPDTKPQEATERSSPEKGVEADAEPTPAMLTKHVVKGSTRDILRYLLLVSLVLSAAVLGVASSLVDQAGVAPPGVLVVGVFAATAALVGCLVGLYGTRRVMQDLKGDDDGRETTGQRLIQAYFHSTVIALIILVPVAIVVLSQKADLSKLYFYGSAATLDWFAALTILLGLFSPWPLWKSVKVVSKYETIQSVILVFAVGFFAVAAVISCFAIALLKNSAFLSVNPDVTGGAAGAVLAVVLLALVVGATSVVGFGAAWGEKDAKLRLHVALCAVVALMAFVCAIGVAVRGSADLIKDPETCRILIQGTASPFFTSLQCNKLGFSDPWACPNGKNDLKARSNAWELAHAETLDDGTGVCVQRHQCLDNSCCTLLAAAVAAGELYTWVGCLIICAMHALLAKLSWWLHKNNAPEVEGKARVNQKSERLERALYWGAVAVGGICLVAVAAFLLSGRIEEDPGVAGGKGGSLFSPVVKSEAQLAGGSGASSLCGGVGPVPATLPVVVNPLAHSCANGKQDGAETDVDCGGKLAAEGCGPSCVAGQRCASTADCRAPDLSCDPNWSGTGEARCLYANTTRVAPAPPKVTVRVSPRPLWCRTAAVADRWYCMHARVAASAVAVGIGDAACGGVTFAGPGAADGSAGSDIALSWSHDATREACASVDVRVTAEGYHAFSARVHVAPNSFGSTALDAWLMPITGAPTTPAPTEAPTPAPTEAPTLAPTGTTKAPTPKTVPTKAPTEMPTLAPTTATPTKEPSPSPTNKPSPFPTEHPSPAPTKDPSPSPTVGPTKAPTADPTKAPTKAPTTNEPTTAKPTPAPTYAPTEAPTKAPTTATPTAAPTLAPSVPTHSPTAGTATVKGEVYSAVSGHSMPARVLLRAGHNAPTAAPVLAVVDAWYKVAERTEADGSQCFRPRYNGGQGAIFEFVDLAPGYYTVTAEFSNDVAEGLVGMGGANKVAYLAFRWAMQNATAMPASNAACAVMGDLAHHTDYRPFDAASTDAFADGVTPADVGIAVNPRLNEGQLRVVLEWEPVNIVQNTFSDRARCIAQLRPGSSFPLSALRFLDRPWPTGWFDLDLLATFVHTEPGPPIRRPAAATPACSAANRARASDGFCDSDTALGANTAECGWDGGDCCADTNPLLASDTSGELVLPHDDANCLQASLVFINIRFRVAKVLFNYFGSYFCIPKPAVGLSEVCNVESLSPACGDARLERDEQDADASEGKRRGIEVITLDKVHNTTYHFWAPVDECGVV